MSEDTIYIIRIIVYFIVAIAVVLTCRYFLFIKGQKEESDEVNSNEESEE